VLFVVAGGWSRRDRRLAITNAAPTTRSEPAAEGVAAGRGPVIANYVTYPWMAPRPSSAFWAA
jgi:hypothetical protein